MQGPESQLLGGDAKTAQLCFVCLDQVIVGLGAGWGWGWRYLARIVPTYVHTDGKQCIAFILTLLTTVSTTGGTYIFVIML